MPGEGGIEARLATAQAKKVRKLTPAQQYATLPKAQRQAQLASRGVLKPAAAKQIGAVHKKRVVQLKTDSGARDRLAQREAMTQVAAALHQATAKPKKLTPVKASGSNLAVIRGIGEKGALAIAPGIAGTALGALSAADKVLGTHTVKAVGKTIHNIPGDAAELAVTTPSSIAKLASTAVTHPTKVPGMLAAPYIELYHHPGRTLQEHPVSTALMVAPAAKLPGRVVGRVARVAGKQTLERPAATLAGTALKQTRIGSRDAFVRAYQARQDAKTPARMTVEPRTVNVRGRDRQIKRSDVQRRVDEFYDFARKQQRRSETAATKQFKDLPEQQRAQRMSGARGGSKRQIQRRFAQEFGSTWHHQDGALVKPKDATQGMLHKTKADAQAVADAITGKGLFDPKVYEIAGKTPGSTRYAVVPRVAAERLAKHKVVGTSKAVGAEVFREGRHAFTQAVLPLSPRWLLGQGVEAAFRAAVAGAGPTNLARGIRVVRAAEKEKKGLGTELRMRTMGGHFGETGTARDLRTVHDLGEAPDLGELGNAAEAGKAVHPKKVGLVRRGWHRYTDTVFNVVNGTIEKTAQTAMLGKAVKQSPLMERHIVGLSDKAIQEAAQGLHGTETQIALGRAVDRMYGQYAKFGPGKRETLLHTTPFFPWYRNVVTFLTKTLPVDHPVKASLIASLDTATEDWRKANKVSLHGKGRRPDFLLGMYPTAADTLRAAGRYLPFAPADVTGAAGSLVLPQFSGMLENLGGVDWKGQRLKHPGYKGKEFNQGERLIRALATQAESLIPGTGQAARISGLEARIDKKDLLKQPSLKERALKEVDPFKTTTTASPAKTAKPGQVGKIVLPKGTAIKVGKIVLPPGF